MDGNLAMAESLENTKEPTLTIHDLDFMDGYIDGLYEFGLSDSTYNEVKEKIKNHRKHLKH